MCKHVCIQVSVIFCVLILMPEAQQYLKATWDRCCISQELVLLAPGMGSASLASRRGWMSFASSRSCLFLLSSLLATSTNNDLHPCLGSVMLLFSLGYSKCLRGREKRGHEQNLIEIGKGSLDKRAGANTAIPFADALNVITFLPGYVRASSSYASGVGRVAYQTLSWLDPCPAGLGKSLPSSSLGAEPGLH